MWFTILLNFFPFKKGEILGEEVLGGVLALPQRAREDGWGPFAPGYFFLIGRPQIPFFKNLNIII